MPGDGGGSAGASVEDASAKERIEILKQQLQEQSDVIEKNIGYYKTLYVNSKWRSIGLKTIAIVGFVVGVLAPVVDDVLGTPESNLLPIGFFCLTVAGLALGLDRAMMISANRLNFNKALVELIFLRRGFEIDRNRFDWLAGSASEPGELADQVFEAMRETEAVRVEILRAESESWSEGYKASVSDLKDRIASASQGTRTALSEKATREEATRLAASTGFVTLHFTRSDKPKVQVALAGQKRMVAASTNPAVIDSLPPGPQRLSVTWEDNGNPQEIERVINVVAGSNTETEIDLARS
jgi:hypothetical protein